MLLYLTSNQKSGLIDGVTREMLMPSKKLVGKFSLKSFVTKEFFIFFYYDFKWNAHKISI